MLVLMRNETRVYQYYQTRLLSKLNVIEYKYVYIVGFDVWRFVLISL